MSLDMERIIWYTELRGVLATGGGASFEHIWWEVFSRFGL